MGIGHKGQAVSLTCVLAQDIIEDENGYMSHKRFTLPLTPVLLIRPLETTPTCWVFFIRIAALLSRASVRNGAFLSLGNARHFFNICLHLSDQAEMIWLSTLLTKSGVRAK